MLPISAAKFTIQTTEGRFWIWTVLGFVRRKIRISQSEDP